MAFDEVQFPLRVGFGSQGGPAFSTEIITVDGGYERRNQNWSQARRRFDAGTGLRAASDVSSLLNFFHARAGRARGFRLKDWSDYTSASDGTSASAFSDQALGVGDGTATIFQLSKTYSSGGVDHTRHIRKPVSGSVSVGVDGTAAASGWSVDTATGEVTFAVAPLDGAELTAGFTFDVPVRFDTDQLNLTAENFLGAEAHVPLIEVRI
ncbi:MAG TPA: DUF2460 domain-containing protein [Alphaproteobacteria bacterium]|nr:DUF2460 domain-containing protein [Alphaproteobacteria bacterium]